jgi:two-component system, chemotaxis family, CheB/CheR fusion protein
MTDGDSREGILSLLAGRRGIDFRDYRSETLDNGLRGRLDALSLGGLEEYHRRLEEDPHEVDQLMRALVVPFTAFFRDSRVFEALASAVLPRLFDHTWSLPVRTWAIGVATGEEAWSVAMLLAEASGPEVPWRFEVVASDVDASSLAMARQGQYPSEAAMAIPPPLRARFVEHAGNECRIAEGLRPHVRFAQHDLMGRVLAPREAVVASFSLVLVRNVLIYFDRRLQSKALDRLAAVVEPGGALVLGDTETLPPAFADRFTPFPGVDRRLRVYRRTEVGR